MGSIINIFKSKNPYISLDHMCPICHDDLTNFNSIILDCGHRFHASCIFDSMYHNYKKCPMCRNKIKYPYRSKKHN